MARICSRCKFYNADGTVTECPSCKVPLQFTLLPPANQPAPPRSVGAPPTATLEHPPIRSVERAVPTGSSGWGGLFGLVQNYRIFVGLVFIPLVLLLGPIFGWGKGSLKDRYDRIEIGMSRDEVDRILDPRPDRRSFTAKDRANGVSHMTAGASQLWWEEAGAKLHIQFYDGYVVKKSQAGLE